MKRTTYKHYDADLLEARELIDQRTQFAYAYPQEPNLAEEADKWIGDKLNNEWERGITIDEWVERTLTEMGHNRRRHQRA
jgi:translation elongation factor EF-1alpha